MTINSNMSNSTDSAYLELIIGPMFSGKTSRIVEIYKKCKFCDISVTVINHILDDRYDDTLLSTHDKIKIPCVKTDKLMELYNNSNMEQILNSEVILINEGQFFSDLQEFVKKMLKIDKKIYVCGLDGDFERKKFGQILDLIPLCDKVTKLTSLCNICKNGTHAIFSKRVSLETEQTIVGFDNYIPVCRKCYEK